MKTGTEFRLWSLVFGRLANCELSDCDPERVMTVPIQSEYYAVVQHPHEPQVLLLPDGAGLGLPGFVEHGLRFWQDVDHVNRGLEATLGAAVQTLRCLDLRYEREHDRLIKVYAVSPLHVDWVLPPGARWVRDADLDDLALTRSEHASVLADWFAWLAADPATTNRAPWYRSGWLDQARGWAIAQLAAAGTPIVAPVEQLRSWQRSAILRLRTAAGPAYFKAVPPMFGHEPPLTVALAATDPTRFARPIAVEPEQGWLLMHAVAGTSLADVHEDLAPWEAALRSFAEVQIALAARYGELRTLGVPERRLADLAADAVPLLADSAATLPGEPAGLNAEQRVQLRALAPRLPQAIAELAAYRLPATLEHGDLWPGQIFIADDRIAFIDWSDSSIAHPFFSLLLFLEEIEDYVPKEPDVRNRLRDAYLEPWLAYGAKSELIRAFELAQPLAALHHALAYHRVVLPNMELKWEMELMLPFYLKLLLRTATQQGFIYSGEHND